MMGQADGHADDGRLARTRAWIVTAFGRLVLARRYDKIRVADITRQAGVGRSTFYEHFRNKDEVHRQAVGHLLGVLADAVMPGADPRRTTHILDHFLKNKRAALGMLEGATAEGIADQHAGLIAERLTVMGAAARGEMGVPLSLAAEQAARSQLTMIRAWLEKPSMCPAATLAAAIHESTRALAASLLAMPTELKRI